MRALALALALSPAAAAPRGSRSLAERGAGAADSPPPLVVNLTAAAGESVATVLAAQVCAGLLNRDGVPGGGVFTLMHDEDTEWLARLAPRAAPPVSAAAFIAQCLASGAARGRVRFAAAAQHELLPNIVTAAAVLDAVPLEDGSPFGAALPVAFDAVSEWAGFRALNATAYAYARWANLTTTLAKMNPGWDVHGSAPLDPPLTNWPDLSLVDWIVKRRLFNFFLLDGCIPGTAEHALMDAMASSGPWPRPLAVWGYDDTFAIAGDVFEAETTCSSALNMGQIASVGVNNLAWFSRAPPVTTPLARNTTRAVFNASKTYVALVVGDGDNVAFVKSSRFAWLQERAAACAGAAPRCFPLLWTISPHLAGAAPDMLRALNALALSTGADSFVLPPSGHLYSYPSLMPADVQAAFVAATEADAALLSSAASVEWELTGSWPRAIADYLPRYAARGVVRSFFAVNVPYLLPIINFTEPFKVVGENVVLFRPNEWRGTSGGDDPLEPFLPSAAALAARVNAWPRGTVAAIYLTSDGGGRLQDFADLAAALGEHVEAVGDEVGDLALVSARARAG